MSNQSLAQLQQENERFAAQCEHLTLKCEHLQAELTELRSRYTSLHQSESQNHQAPLLSTVAQIANLLLRSPDYTTVLPDVVRLLGEAVGSDRCSIGQKMMHPTSGKSAVRIMPEWCKAGILHSEDFSPHLDRFFLWEDAVHIAKKLQQGEVVNCLVCELPEPDRSLLAAQGNTAELFVPILIKSQCWGFIGIDNCGEPRLYDEAEIAILKVAAESIAAAIERQAQDEALRESERRYRTLFELSSEGIVRFGYRQPIPLTLSVDEQLNLCYQSIYIAEANDAYAKMLECEKAEDLIGTTLNDFHDRNSEVTQATMRSWIENRYFCRQLETVEFDRHGRKHYFLNSSSSMIENNCVTSTWVSQVDITELREAQQALLEAEQQRLQELERLNTELRQTLDRLQTRDHILEATATATTTLLTTENLDKAVNTALQIIGEGLDTDRVSVLEMEPFDRSSNLSCVHWQVLYEWHSPYTVSQLLHPDCRQGNHEGIEAWLERLSHGDHVSCLLEEMPELFRSGQAAIRVKALHVIPIFINGQFWGTVGIDDCRESKRRTTAELSVLKIAADCIGSAIQQQRTQQALLEAEQQRAAELVKANEALARASERLAEQPDLSAFLSHIALEAIAQLDADAAMLSILDESRQVLKSVAHVEQGHIPVSTLAAEMPVNEAGFVRVLLETRKPRYFNLEQEAHLFWQGVSEYHHQRHHQAVVAVPLFAGGKFLGHLELAFMHTEPIKEQSSELLYALAQQAALAIQLTQLAEEARQLAVFQERNHIAREIHDTLAQDFAGILMQLQAVTRLCTLDPDQAQLHLARACNLARTGLAEARRSVWALRQDSTEYSEFIQLLTQLTEQLAIDSPVQTQVLVEGTPYPLSPEAGLNLLRIAQEAITNALRHANAQHIELHLTYTPHYLQLCIRDDGQGFDLQTLTRGFGLMGMQQRADLIGAHLRITSSPAAGTLVEVIVPSS
jgi:signal transduction histidine kinase/PAS domain-containing protein